MLDLIVFTVKGVHSVDGQAIIGTAEAELTTLSPDSESATTALHVSLTGIIMASDLLHTAASATSTTNTMHALQT